MLAALALAVIVGLLGLALRAPDGPLGDGLVRGSYDSLHILIGGRTDALADSPVVIVYLDLNSFRAQGMNPLQPWPRTLHAQLLRKLKTAGALAVVFDIIFSDVGLDASADRDLAEAIRDNGQVVLAAELNDDASHVTGLDQPWTRTMKVLPPVDQFATNAASWGLASHMIDDDFVVRRYLAGFTSQELPSLTWAAAGVLRLDRNAVGSANQHWIRYYGSALAIPHVSYAEALSPAGVPPHFFNNKTVLIGARPMAEQFHERQDEFRNPFHSWGHKELFMPGVEVHATELLNLVRGDWLQRLSTGAESGWLLVVAILFGGGLIWLRPAPGTAVALAGAGLALGASLVAFDRGTWFPWLIVSGAQIPVALGGSVLFHSLEWYRARKRYEAAKRIADAKIREQAALIDKAHDAILVRDLNGAIIYANRSAERLYGWSTVELQHGGAVGELFSPDPEAARVARTAAIKDGEWNGELQQQTKSGRVVIVASRWTLILDEAGQPRELLLINSDITEQKDLEQQFLRTQRMNTIGTLAGGMAHDLNNALAPILMGAQLLRRKAKDDDSRELLGMMEASTHRGADMVRQVLLFARGRGGEFERLELGALVKELEKMVRETFPKNVQVDSFLPGDLWPVRGNPTQLHQVMLNLFVNARDAMPDGGKLSFVADNVELTAAEACAIPEGQPGEYVSLLVSDTGTGMPPEVRARIFEPFFSTKGEGRGSGIGLSTVMRIVKSHGGFMRVESEVGQGTAFEAFLPRAADAVPVETAAAAAHLPRGHGEVILVADDEIAIRELIATELASFGYRVLKATHGVEALALFRQHADEVRLFITDGAMPVMSGLQAIIELRKLKPGLPVILTSAEACVGAPDGVVAVAKPFALEELLVAIERSLKSA